jgi:hypothetical protein
MKPATILSGLLLAGLLAHEAPAQTFRPDLHITGFSLSSTDFREGTEIVWTFNVQNIGTAASGPFTVGLYLSSNAEINPYVDWRLSQFGNPGLPIGFWSHWEVRVVVPQGLNPVTYYAGPYADDRFQIDEFTEWNNYDSLQVTGNPFRPDLEVTALSSNPTAVSGGMPVRLTATVRNIGERFSPATTAAFYLSRSHLADSPSGAALGTVPVPAIAVNGSTQVILDTTLASVPHGGDAYWVVQVAPTSVPELNTGNNNRSEWVRCSVTPSLVWNRDLLGPANSGFGQSVGAAGDLDGDGSDDLIVGLPSDDTAGIDAGAARVYSGRTGTLLWTFPGPSADAQQGSSVAGAGDVDGDGVPDLIVGAPYASGGGLSRSGRATLYSGRTGSAIRFHEGEASNARLGLAVAGAGDVDGDGFDDVAITSPGDQGGGSVRLHSGRTGARLFIFIGPSGSGLGQSVANAGDVNGDGFPDLIVGAPTETASRSAYVLSGRTGQLIRRIQGPGEDFGYSVCGAGDVDGDGTPDLAVGAPGSSSAQGQVLLFSGRTFALLLNAQGWQTNESFGTSLAGGGDVNGDGTPDLVVGAPGAQANGIASGRTAVLSGRDLSTLFSFVGWPASNIGRSVALLRDVNDDGRADVFTGGDGASGAMLFVTAEKTIGRSSTFGAPGATSGGLRPRAVIGGSPQIGTTVSLALRAAPPANLVLMLLGFARTDVDLGPSGAPGNRLYTFPALVLQLLTGADGRVSLPIALPDEPGLVGAQAFVQWAVFDPPANALGYVASDAARIVLGRL